MNKIPARVRHVLLPLLSMAATILIVLIFVASNPGDIRSLFSLRVLALLGIQVAIFLVSLLQTWLLGRRLVKLVAADPQMAITPDRLMMLGGNVLGVGQVLLCIAIWNAFWFNLHKVEFISIWAFLAIILVVGLVAPAFLILMILKGRTARSR